MFNLDTPFFRPPWRRALTLVVAFGWGLLEFAGGQVFWGILFFAMGGAASWQFSIVDWTKYDRPRQEER